MQGKILDYNVLTSEGYISGDDGARYRFSGVDIKSQVNAVVAGSVVDFIVADGRATEIFLVKTAANIFSPPIGQKSKLVAALLAFFLGVFGLHKFYLGYNKAGIIMLLCTFPGAVLFGIPAGVVYVIALIEFVLYLTKSDEDFYQNYEVGKREWF